MAAGAGIVGDDEVGGPVRRGILGERVDRDGAGQAEGAGDRTGYVEGAGAQAQVCGNADRLERAAAGGGAAGELAGGEAAEFGDVDRVAAAGFVRGGVRRGRARIGEPEVVALADGVGAGAVGRRKRHRIGRGAGGDGKAV